LNQLENIEAEHRAELGKLDQQPQPTHYTAPQLKDLAEAIKTDLRDENKTRVTIRGLVTRVIARRTDDQIIGIMHCNKVIGQVPPSGREAMTLFYQLVIPIRKRKAPEIKSPHL